MGIGSLIREVSQPETGIGRKHIDFIEAGQVRAGPADAQILQSRGLGAAEGGGGEIRTLAAVEHSRRGAFRR
jgi:hypothetical protein